jgi:NAD(P)-dependent dehydrogenase (short-subunit alcohol dehydrogenase family)
MFAQVHDRLGRLDVLIANAAIALTGPLIDFATTDLDALLAVNLRGTFLCCRQALKIMAPQRSGYIIVISSIAGLKTYPEQSAYAATKHGLMGMTKGLAIEAQEYGIRVSAVLPGGVDTQMVRAARPDLDRSVLLQSDDIAKTILFLLSLADRAAIDQIYIRRRASQPFP